MFNLLIQQEDNVLINEKFDTFESLKQYLIEKGADLLSASNGKESDHESSNFDKVENLDDIKDIFREYNNENWTASISRDE